MERLEMLTVEEAAGVLRIGRTKAYAMARQWRDSGGRAGLPVVDLGHVLRVPRRALEAMLDVGLDLTSESSATKSVGSLIEMSRRPSVAPREPSPSRPSRRRQFPKSQPALFEAPPSAGR